MHRSMALSFWLMQGQNASSSLLSKTWFSQTAHEQMPMSAEDWGSYACLNHSAQALACMSILSSKLATMLSSSQLSHSQQQTS